MTGCPCDEGYAGAVSNSPQSGKLHLLPIEPGYNTLCFERISCSGANLGRRRDGNDAVGNGDTANNPRGGVGAHGNTTGSLRRDR